MRIQLQNRYLVSLLPFLQGMKLKGQKSRARSKFLALVSEAYAALHESEVELLKEYAMLDDKGEPKISDEGSFLIKDNLVKEYLSEREKLFSESAEIEGGTYTEHLTLMWQIITDYDEELEGENAALYDALCDTFETEISQEDCHADE